MITSVWCLLIRVRKNMVFFHPVYQRKSGNCSFSNAYEPCMCMVISSKESLIMCFYGKAAFRHCSPCLEEHGAQASIRPMQ